MNFIIWLVIGGVIGWLASMVMRTDAQQGVILNVVVGIVGALLGGWLISPLVGVADHQPGRIQHSGDARVAGRRNHPSGHRQPVPPRPSTLVSQRCGLLQRLSLPLQETSNG